MKNKPPLYFIFFFFLILLQPFISPAQVSEEDRKNRCENNKNEIARLTKLISSLNASLGQAWTKNKIEQAKKDLELTKKALSKVESYRPLTPQDKGTDKDNLKKVVEPLFVTDIYYTSEQYTLGYFFNRDFNANGKLLKSSAFNTIRRLIQLRGAITKKLDKAIEMEPQRPGLEKQLRENTEQLSYHQNRFIELKCDGLPAETVKKKEEKKPAETKPTTTTTGTSTGNNTTTNRVVPSPTVIELEEHTDKYGTYKVTLTKNKDGDFEGVYNNLKKAVIQLRIYDPPTLYMFRLSPSVASYDGTITGSGARGTMIIGGATGTFKAKFR